MNNKSEAINAEVIAVYPNKVKISVDKLEDFKIADTELKVGSYLRIADNENAILIAMIENFSIEVDNEGNRKYLIEANPLGMLKENEFHRGGDAVAIPPKKVEPAKNEDISMIYKQSMEDTKKFIFSSLATNKSIRIPIDGDKFFNKHIAIVGSTGSGKSHTVTRIIQNVINEKDGKYKLNNSHVVIFDIHSEYATAFPEANLIGIDELVLPYWMLNSEELEEILLDTGERDNYNQSSVFRNLVTLNKKLHNKEQAKIFYDSPLFFDIDEILNALFNLRNETRNSRSLNKYMIVDNSYKLLTDGKTDDDSGIELDEEARINKYFTNRFRFHPTKNQYISKGNYADGTLDKFYSRFSSKVKQDRLQFLFGPKSKKITFEETLKKIMGYGKENTNVTIIDLSGIPFEVLSITVSLISRMLFEYGYIYSRYRNKNQKDNKINNDVPILLVFEEAHKYAPRSDLAKYRASKISIERIAKEGRKYGVSLLLASQRPSEISETIFSQCNNFIAMRLTNPDDQNYVKRLLPDALGNLIEKLPALNAGDALLIGDAIILPTIVKIDPCEKQPSSNDIPYWKLWKEQWKVLDFKEIKKEWYS